MAENPYRQALAYLGPNGEHWMKGDLFNREDNPTKACILGALTTHDFQIWIEDCYENNQYSPGYLFLRDIIRELFPERRPTFSMTGGVAHFNDHPDTTFENVRVTLEKASIRWDEECDIRGTL